MSQIGPRKKQHRPRLSYDEDIRRLEQRIGVHERHLKLRKQECIETNSQAMEDLVDNNIEIVDWAHVHAERQKGKGKAKETASVVREWENDVDVKGREINLDFYTPSDDEKLSKSGNHKCHGHSHLGLKKASHVEVVESKINLDFYTPSDDDDSSEPNKHKSHGHSDLGLKNIPDVERIESKINLDFYTPSDDDNSSKSRNHKRYGQSHLGLKNKPDVERDEVKINLDFYSPSDNENSSRSEKYKFHGHSQVGFEIAPDVNSTSKSDIRKLDGHLESDHWMAKNMKSFLFGDTSSTSILSRNPLEERDDNMQIEQSTKKRSRSESSWENFEE